MSIPPAQKIPITLRRAIPTPFTTEVLAEKLGSVGLDCDMINDVNLNQSLQRVLYKLENGGIQTFGIARRSRFASSRSTYSSEDVEDVATGNWEWDITDSPMDFKAILSTIAYPDHFNWLHSQADKIGFTGVIEDREPKEGYYDNENAIEELFVDAGLAASSTLVEGLDKPSMEAALINIIRSDLSQDLSDYQDPQPGEDHPSTVMYLIANYNESGEGADGIGVLSFSWQLRIKDYKEKDKYQTQHDTFFDLRAFSVLYSHCSGIDQMCDHYDMLVEEFNLNRLECRRC